ncbi:MAG: acyl carrier protein [Rhodobacteraceae bacterium]|nr:acyl carrier protein [Paracoccaceae bacterium]MCY4139785.1 acyl carrier protein [Paracoccaceae bacterium]
MSATKERVRKLFREHLDPKRDPDFDIGLGDSGVSSVDAVYFVKKVGDAFNVEIQPSDVAKFQNLGDLVSYLDAHAK